LPRNAPMLDLTNGKEGKLIIRFTMPMLIGNVFQQLYNVVDSIIVGKFIGKEALGAVGAAFPVIFVLISFVVGIASGSTIIISQYYGAKQFNNIKKAIDTIFIFLFFAALVITAAGLLLSRFIFMAIGLPEVVIPQATLYLQVYLSGIILFFGYNGVTAILRGLGDSRTPLVFLIISTIMNILLDLLFVLVFGWGVAGVAIATVISQGGAFITSVIYLNRTHEIINLRFRNLIWDREIFEKSIQIGLPSGLQMTFVSLGMMALYGIVASFGTDVVAAFTVASRIDSFAMLPAMTFAMGLSTFVGQNMGAQKPERVRKGYQVTLLMTTLISVSVTILVIFFSHSLMALFTSDPVVIKKGIDYLVIVSSFYLLFNMMFISNGVMRGAGDTLIPMLITLLSLWLVRIPFSWVLSKAIGINGVWWGIPLAWGIGALFSFIYYQSGKWKRKVVVNYVEEPEVPELI